MDSIQLSEKYKQQHEAFVKNEKGSSVATVMISCAHLPVLVLILRLIQIRYNKSKLSNDLIILVYPLLLAMTVFAEISDVLLICAGLLSILLVCSSKKVTIPIDTTTGSNQAESKREKSISMFKGGNLLLTVIAILAVDFPIFPRSFAKTETFGISLMDIGVGSFVVSSALTSKFARNSNSSKNNKNNNDDSNQQMSLLQRVRTASAQRMVVLALGVGRLFALKLCNYQEQVSEYGIHWNFFVTLFFVWTIADLCHRVLSPSMLVLFSVVVLLSYQWLLLQTDLTEYVFTAPRDESFFAANREGILSLAGYVPLYLITEGLSQRLFFSSNPISINDYNAAGINSNSGGYGSFSVVQGNISKESGSAESSASTTAAAVSAIAPPRMALPLESTKLVNDSEAMPLLLL